jgi:hypothetical protein
MPSKYTTHLLPFALQNLNANEFDIYVTLKNTTKHCCHPKLGTQFNIFLLQWASLIGPSSKRKTQICEGSINTRFYFKAWSFNPKTHKFGCSNMITYPYTPLPPPLPPPQYLSVQKQTKQKQCTSKNKTKSTIFWNCDDCWQNSLRNQSIEMEVGNNLNSNKRNL